MQIHQLGYDLSSPDYLCNVERILTALTLSEHRIAQATLHGTPVYIVADMQLAKQIFEDGQNFSITANAVADDASLTEGARAFVSEGLESPLLASSYDEYKETRHLFNQAFKHSVTYRLDDVRRLARERIAALLNDIRSPDIDVLKLCRDYWIPLAADVIGLSSLTGAELELLVASSRTLIEANGLQGTLETIETLTRANGTLVELIHKVFVEQSAPPHSAISYLLGEVDAQKAARLTLSFVLGGIETGSSALALQTYLLATNAGQRADFIALSEPDQQSAITELASKEGPAYYTPRFAVRDVNVMGIDFPAGTFFQLALHGLNSCANADFDVQPNARAACPMRRNETLPFGHARHKCPGESLARHLIPIFLDEVFSRYEVVSIPGYRRDIKSFARSIGEFIMQVKPR